MFEDYTASGLADELDDVQYCHPQATGHLSQLDEATLRWTIRHPGLTLAHRAFAQARSRHNPAAGRDNWAEIVATTQALAQALYLHGGARLQFCGARSVYGTCHGLVHDGPCTRMDDHVND